MIIEMYFNATFISGFYTASIGPLLNYDE